MNDIEDRVILANLTTEEHKTLWKILRSMIEEGENRIIIAGKLIEEITCTCGKCPPAEIQEIQEIQEIIEETEKTMNTIKRIQAKLFSL